MYSWITANHSSTTIFFRNPQTDAEEFFQDASLMMFSKFRHLLLGLAIYEGFLKWWYPQIIHFRL